MHFLIKIIFFGFISINGYSSSRYLSFAPALEMQEMFQKYIHALVHSPTQPDPVNTKAFFSLINIKNSHQLANFALFSSILGNRISQEEMDKLWLLSTQASIDFSKTLGIYLCGRIIGLSILNNYKQLNSGQLKGEVSFDITASEKAWIQTMQPILNQLLAHSTNENYVTKKVGSFPTLSQYKDFMDQMITSYQTDPGKIYQYINPAHASNPIHWNDIVKTFENLVGSEYCILWLNQYTALNTKKSRQVLESKLLKAPTEALVLSCQRILAQHPSNPFPQAITAYTLAVTKDKSYQKKLDNLIKMLVENKKVKAFEPLLLQEAPPENKKQPPKTSKK